MSKELVRVVGERVAFGEAVTRVAEALSPLGTLARVVAESTACAVALQEIRLTARSSDVDANLRLARLENRRREASAALRQLRTSAGHAHVTASALTACVVNLQRAIVRPRASAAELRACNRALEVMTATLLNHTGRSGDQLVASIDAVLNGAGSSSPARVPIPPPRAGRAAARDGSRRGGPASGRGGAASRRGGSPSRRRGAGGAGGAGGTGERRG